MFVILDVCDGNILWKTPVINIVINLLSGDRHCNKPVIWL